MRVYIQCTGEEPLYPSRLQSCRGGNNEPIRIAGVHLQWDKYGTIRAGKCVVNVRRINGDIREQQFSLDVTGDEIDRDIRSTAAFGVDSRYFLFAAERIHYLNRIPDRYREIRGLSDVTCSIFGVRSQDVIAIGHGRCVPVE